MNTSIGYNLAGISYWTQEFPQNNVALCIGTDGADSILKLMVPTSGNYAASFTGTGTVTIGSYTIKAGAAPVNIALYAGTDVYTVTINGTIASLTILPVGVAAGVSPAFLAALKGANASVLRTVQWQASIDSVNWISSTSPGNQSGSLTTGPVAAGTWLYRAVFTNAAGTATTAAATLTVNPVVPPAGSGDSHAWYVGQDSVTGKMRTVSIF